LDRHRHVRVAAGISTGVHPSRRPKRAVRWHPPDSFGQQAPAPAPAPTVETSGSERSFPIGEGRRSVLSTVCSIARQDTAQRDPNVSARKAHTCREQHSQQSWFDRSAHLLRLRWHRRRPPRWPAAERRQHRQVIHLVSARLHVSHASGGTAAVNSSGVEIARPDRTTAAAVTRVDVEDPWERAQWPP
jgi:hypothetical protein